MRTMENENKEYILRVYGALQEKGYNAVGQIVGYLLTEDPTYDTTASETPWPSDPDAK